MRLLWLPEVLRGAGLTVHEVGGWRDRGSSSFDPRGIICHETRGSKTSTDTGEIHVLLDGSATAPPPIAQLYLSRTGHWHVIASGRCNHVRVGWAGPFKGVGNSGLLGIEAQHALGEPWTDRQYRSYVTGVAALARKLGVPVSRVAGHKEHQPAGYGHSSTKTDPSFNMDQFRRDVAAVLAGEDDDMQLSDTVTLVQQPDVQYSSKTTTVGGILASTNYYVLQTRNRLLAEVTGLRAQVTATTAALEALARVVEAGGGSVDVAAIKAHIDARLTAAEAEIRDAVADLGEGGASQVRGPQD